MKKIRRYQILNACLFCAALVFAGNAGFAQSSFDEANACYKNKQYTIAVNMYLDIIKSGKKNAAVYYNLGNSFYQLKELPKAILYFEKALKLDPGNDKIQHNLKLAYDKSLTKIEESHEFFVFKFIHNFTREYSAQTWSVIFLACFWISITSFLIYFNKKPGTASFHLRWGIYGLVISVLLFFVAKDRYREQTSCLQAVILQPNTELKAEPVDASKTKQIIEAGNKVDLLDKDANWYKVLLPNGKEGWIDEKNMVKI